MWTTRFSIFYFSSWSIINDGLCKNEKLIQCFDYFRLHRLRRLHRVEVEKKRGRSSSGRSPLTVCSNRSHRFCLKLCSSILSPPPLFQDTSPFDYSIFFSPRFIFSNSRHWTSSSRQQSGPATVVLRGWFNLQTRPSPVLFVESPACLHPSLPSSSSSFFRP